MTLAGAAGSQRILRNIVLGGLVALNGVAWLGSWIAFGGQPALLGSALLAWLFGLRHAADADHLAAIDNVVRKLMQDGQRPHLVGLFFSLGHSSVVLLACAAIALTASNTSIDPLRTIGAVLGTVVSAGFLVLIAAANLRIFVRLLQGGAADADMDTLLAGRGLLARIVRPATRIVRRPAHMLLLGFLFGLGFDTATEVGLLAMSAAQAASGLSLTQVLAFPCLFTAGMALADTADSAMMVGAYGWALADPGRKRTYNLAVTGISVLLAFGIGGVELSALLADRFELQGGVWQAVGLLNVGMAQIGFAIVALFLAAWGISALLYRRRPAVAYEAPPMAEDGSSGA